MEMIILMTREMIKRLTIVMPIVVMVMLMIIAKTV